LFNPPAAGELLISVPSRLTAIVFIYLEIKKEQQNRAKRLKKKIKEEKR